MLPPYGCTLLTLSCAQIFVVTTSHPSVDNIVLPVSPPGGGLLELGVVVTDALGAETRVTRRIPLRPASDHSTAQQAKFVSSYISSALAATSLADATSSAAALATAAGQLTSALSVFTDPATTQAIMQGLCAST